MSNTYVLSETMPCEHAWKAFPLNDSFLHGLPSPGGLQTPPQTTKRHENQGKISLLFGAYAYLFVSAEPVLTSYSPGDGSKPLYGQEQSL